MSFLYNQRWGLSYWNARFYAKKLPVRAEIRSVESRAYPLPRSATATNVTPRATTCPLKHDRELAGEVLQGWNAYNITSDKTYGVGG